MPRSGTTLTASILSNHRSIDTAGELPTITQFTSRLPKLIEKDVLYPQAVGHITPAIASRLINEYESRLRRDIGPDVPHVVDKSPLNFRHLGFIPMLFPRARIIHCTRHPLDTSLSNYFQHFSLNYDYSFDLKNIGHFYGEYLKTMEHWQNVLPGKILEINYEDMIADTKKMVHTTLDFLGLEWDERCLAPHTNPCVVDTASNWQVRQPIYNQSVERWRHYEKHLTPLKEMLDLTQSGQ
jgi:Sulfotransferase family